MKKLLLPALLGLIPFSGFSIRAEEQPKFIRTEDVIYGHKFGTALTLDVFEPEHKNGAAIFWMVSSGFFSDRERIRPDYFTPLLDRGYTVFAVLHGSRPRYIIPEIEEDIHRAIRFVRHNAAQWGIDPDKFGIGGMSSGGYLSLTIGTQGKLGGSAATDPIDRESSAVQAVACFCPPTDFLNWSRPGEYAPRAGAPVFWQRGTTTESQQEYGREISPIYFVTANMPPTLVFQGDADNTVPFYQSLIFEQKCKEVGAPFKLIVKARAGHAYPGWQKDIVVCTDWFDRHLLGTKAKE